MQTHGSWQVKQFSYSEILKVDAISQVCQLIQNQAPQFQVLFPLITSFFDRFIINRTTARKNSWGNLPMEFAVIWN